MESAGTYKLAVAGLGAIGFAVVRRIGEGAIPNMTLSAVSARDSEKAARRLAEAGLEAEVVGFEALADMADIVVECMPAEHFGALAESVLAKGCVFVPLSVGALLARMDLVDLAERSGARILVPTGALVGLDAVRAAGEGTITSVKLITHKPPRALAGAPLIEAQGIALDDLTEPLQVFAGTAADAVKAFPANVNVSAALSLAGLGPERTQVEVWADPAIDTNSQTVHLESDAARVRMTIENVPTAENPRTGRVTAQSVIALLRRFSATLVAGS